MNNDHVRPLDVLRELVDDVKAAYGTGDGDELDRARLRNDWPDLLATYDHAAACLKSQVWSAATESSRRWQCRDCGKTLSTKDWTYADLADRGTPICGTCDRDMELIQPPGDSAVVETRPNAWIIVDTDDRSVGSRLYDDYAECVDDANALDNALIVGLVLPDRAAGADEEEGPLDG